MVPRGSRTTDWFFGDNDSSLQDEEPQRTREPSPPRSRRAKGVTLRVTLTQGVNVTSLRVELYGYDDDEQIVQAQPVSGVKRSRFRCLHVVSAILRVSATGGAFCRPSWRIVP